MSSSTSTQPAIDDATWWRGQAQIFAREAALAARTLQGLLADSTDTPPATLPLPLPPLGMFSASEDLVYNIEEFRRHDYRYVLRGWAFVRSSRNCSNSVLCCILRSGENSYALPVVRIRRPDVSEAFPLPAGKDAERAHTGFFCQFDSFYVTNATAEAFLVLQDAGRVHCSGSLVPGT